MTVARCPALEELAIVLGQCRDHHAGYVPPRVNRQLRHQLGGHGWIVPATAPARIARLSHAEARLDAVDFAAVLVDAARRFHDA